MRGVLHATNSLMNGAQARKLKLNYHLALSLAIGGGNIYTPLSKVAALICFRGGWGVTTRWMTQWGASTT